MPAQVFRAGVAIVVRRENGDLMAFERCDVPGSWQLPQGGIDIGEDPLNAAWRELHEETGLTDQHVSLVSELPEWIAYEWPVSIRENSRFGPAGRGQIQKWFLFGTRHDDITPTVDHHEFQSWSWMDPHRLLHQVVEFRRDAYMRAFSRLLP